MKSILMLLLTCFIGMQAVAQPKNLQALFSYKTFYSPENGPYIETYLSVNSETVKYVKNSNGKYQGAIEIGISFSDASGIKYTDKYNLLSPEVDDTTKIQFSFLDQQRIPLAHGQYKLDLTITDKNASQKSYAISEAVTIQYYNNILAVSDIQFIDSYNKSTTPSIITKSGYDLVPYVDNFFTSQNKSLKFYAEIYNSDKIIGQTPYLVTYFVESAESKQVIENLKGFHKQNPDKVNVLLREIPLSDLPSGNYNLVIEVRNQQNELLTSRASFFQNSNKVKLPSGASDYTQTDISNTFASYITDKDTLSDFINSLHPISSPLELTFLTNQMKLADVKIMQQFFYDFWAKRSPVNPEKAWLDYHQEVLKVNQAFSTKIIPGYATERGRVYLKYGPPNTMGKHYTEPSAYPYEIWHYYKMGTQTNRKFVFYNPDLVTNDFILIHSDAQGEITNQRWQMIVYKRDTQSRDFDVETKSTDYFGNQVNDNYINPR
jgi:GWxTD domain-containing protein